MHVFLPLHNYVHLCVLSFQNPVKYSSYDDDKCEKRQGAWILLQGTVYNDVTQIKCQSFRRFIVFLTKKGKYDVLSPPTSLHDFVFSSASCTALWVADFLSFHPSAKYIFYCGLLSAYKETCKCSNTALFWFYNSLKLLSLNPLC